MPEQQDAMEHLAEQVWAALESADLSAFRDLLDPDVHWGAPDDPSSPACQNRDHVLAWYKQARESGVRARVSETVVLGAQIVVGLRVVGNRAATDTGSEVGRWEVLTVRDGRVVDIVGFDDRGDAVARADSFP